MFKRNYDYFLQLRSLDSAFFTLQVLVHLDNETTRLYLDKASQKPRLCNDVWIKVQVKILHVKSVENASKRPMATWKTKEQSFPKYGTLLRKQWVWNEKSLAHLSFFYFSHYDAFEHCTRALMICWFFCFKLRFGCLFAYLIPQTCTFLANKLLKAGKTLIFQLVILKKSNFQLAIGKKPNF